MKFGHSKYPDVNNVNIPVSLCELKRKLINFPVWEFGVTSSVLETSAMKFVSQRERSL